MIVRSSVDLPTPLRPKSDRRPFAGSSKAMPSSTTASPYPARTSRSASMGLAEIHLAHRTVVRHFVRRALHEDAATGHYDDAASEAEHHAPFVARSTASS